MTSPQSGSISLKIVHGKMECWGSKADMSLILFFGMCPPYKTRSQSAKSSIPTFQYSTAPRHRSATPAIFECYCMAFTFLEVESAVFAVRPCFFMSAEKFDRCMPTCLAAWAILPSAAARAFCRNAFSIFPKLFSSR